MGLKIKRDVPAMERELNNLLNDLCINWGFCLPKEKSEQISKMEYCKVEDFAIDVVKAEGFDGYTEWTSKITQRFIERFGTDKIDSETFIDRVRGEKEIW